MAECVKKTKDLIKCFCGCTGLTIDEVKKISRASAEQILSNQSYRTLFKSYLKTENPTGLSDESPASQMLTIYEKSLELQAQDEITEDDIDEFADSGLTWNLEKHLREAYVKDTTKDCLEEVKADYGKQLECSQEFKRFREAIARKLTGYGRK
ncbi:hypothetical protein ACFFRR_010123 [Megaselia abdita]